MTRVHRLPEGASLLLFEPETGVEADALITELSRQEVECRVSELRRCSPLPFQLALFHGMAKGEKLDRAVGEGTALGMCVFTPVICERSVVQMADSQRIASRLERWKRVAVAAARQSGRGDLPVLEPPQRLDALLRAMPEGQNLVLDPRAGAMPLFKALEEIPSRDTPRFNLWVGPEGGFTDEECAELVAVGARTVSLGSLVLRTELAAIAALSVCVAYLDAELEQQGLNHPEDVP